MNTIIVSILAWLMGFAVLFAPLFRLEGEHLDGDPSRWLLLMTSVLLFALLNLPGLLLLRPELQSPAGGGGGRAFAAPVLALNVPALLLATLLAGRTLAPMEALVFTGTAIIVSLAFGLALLWSLHAVTSDE